MRNIEEEQAAQSALVASFDRLPISYTGVGPFPVEALETLGFTVGDEVDEIFMSVLPPEGWLLRATSSALRTDIVNAAGEVVGFIHYQPSAFDRHAFFALSEGGI